MSTCPACGVAVVPGYVKCPKCGTVLPRTRASVTSSPSGTVLQESQERGGNLWLVVGATVVIAVVTLYYQLQDPVYRAGVYAALAWYVGGVIYFAVVGRHKLVLSPEEEFALTGGQHGHPEREGYGTTKL